MFVGFWSAPDVAERRYHQLVTSGSPSRQPTCGKGEEGYGLTGSGWVALGRKIDVVVLTCDVEGSFGQQSRGIFSAGVLACDRSFLHLAPKRVRFDFPSSSFSISSEDKRHYHTRPPSSSPLHGCTTHPVRQRPLCSRHYATPVGDRPDGHLRCRSSKCASRTSASWLHVESQT